MIIHAIPIYYQESTYLSYPHTPRHPTTTAEYIALPPSTDPYISARNITIAKDVIAWGWKIYDVDETSLKMKNWWAQYEAAAKEEPWDDDIWRIWQREHGIRIAGKHAENVDDAKESPSRIRFVVRGMKKVGKWAQKSRDAAELGLRQYEERKKKLQKERERERHVKRKRELGDEIQKDTASEISLPGSFMGRLEAWRGGSANVKKYNPLKLTQHPWLSQR